jgi:hypothetical protein
VKRRSTAIERNSGRASIKHFWAANVLASHAGKTNGAENPRKNFPRSQNYPKLLYSMRLSYDISEIQGTGHFISTMKTNRGKIVFLLVKGTKSTQNFGIL